MRRFQGPDSGIDPHRFGDPVALQTEWTPCKLGGEEYGEENLVQTGPDTMEFRITAGAIGWYAACSAMGLAMLAFSLVCRRPLLPALAGLGLATVGAVLLIFGTKPLVFDKAAGCVYIGRLKPGGHRGIMAELIDVHALQLIPLLVSRKSSDNCYELNLVLHDGGRVNVISHGNRKRIQLDACLLAEFLEVPLWDAVRDVHIATHGNLL